jgi:hypothetical protein
VNGTWVDALPDVPGASPGGEAGLGDLVGDLLEAGDPAQMLVTALRLRRAVTGMRRLLARPAGLVVLAVLLAEPGLPPGWLEVRAENLAARLADQAVNVVTALDYLTVLLSTPADGAQELDRLTRQRLDARATAVRQGTRLLAMLPAGPVHAAEAARDGAGQ